MMNKKLLVLSLLALPARADISGLNWMAGCWAPNGRDAGSTEQWMAPAGGTMFGMSRSVSNGKTVAFEYLRIVEGDDGGITLIASPSGQETALFEMISMSGNEVIFENPQHDFPQRIIYRIGDDGNLVGRIEGTVDGAARAADFPMTKIKCGNPGEPE